MVRFTYEFALMNRRWLVFNYLSTTVDSDLLFIDDSLATISNLAYAIIFQNSVLGFAITSVFLQTSLFLGNPKSNKHKTQQDAHRKHDRHPPNLYFDNSHEISKGSY